MIPQSQETGCKGEKAGWSQVARDKICNLQENWGNGFSEFAKPLKPTLDIQETKAPANLVGRLLQSSPRSPSGLLPSGGSP